MNRFQCRMSYFRRSRLGEGKHADLQTEVNTSAKPQAAMYMLAVSIFSVLVSGCRPEPFLRSPLPALNSPNAQSIRDEYPSRIPSQFTSDDTVLLEAPFDNRFSVLGVLQVDRTAGTFELVGLNPMGVQFFHVAGNAASVSIRDAVPPLMEHKDILFSLAKDIQRMYFAQIPGENYSIDTTSTEVIFSRKNIDGKLTFHYGYNPPVLLEKQLGGCFGATWRVKYYDYRPGENGKLFPHGIVMDNFQYHYRIIVKNRDWAVEEQ